MNLERLYDKITEIIILSHYGAEHPEHMPGTEQEAIVFKKEAIDEYLGVIKKGELSMIPKPNIFHMRVKQCVCRIICEIQDSMREDMT